MKVTTTICDNCRKPIDGEKDRFSISPLQGYRNKLFTYIVKDGRDFSFEMQPDELAFCSVDCFCGYIKNQVTEQWAEAVNHQIATDEEHDDPEYGDPLPE